MIVVLTFRLDKIADLISSTSLFEILHAVEPEVRLILITSPANSSVLQGHPLLSEIRVFDPSWGWKKKWHFIRDLRRLNPIYSFSLSPELTSHWLSYFTGAGIRGGILHASQFCAQFFAPYLLHQRLWLFDKDSQKVTHQTQTILDLARKMNFSLLQTTKITNRYSLPFFKEENIWGQKVLEKVAPPRLLLHLGKEWLERGWERKDLLLFIRGISESFPDVSLILTSTDPEIDFTARDVAPASLFKDLSFRQWATLIEKSTLVITPDTSAVQIASTYNVPVIVVYPPEKKAIFYKKLGPYNIPHRALSQKNESQTLTESIKGIEEICPFLRNCR